MFCYSCGAELPEGAHFCPKCGQSCTVKTNSEMREDIAFEDELIPINDVQFKPKPSLNSAAKKSQGRSPYTPVSDAPLKDGTPEWRVLNENGSGILLWNSLMTRYLLLHLYRMVIRSVCP